MGGFRSANDDDVEDDGDVVDEVHRPWYLEYFVGHDHVNFLGRTTDGRRVAVSIIEEKSQRHYRAIVRTKLEEDHCIVPFSEVKIFFGLWLPSWNRLLHAIDPQLDAQNLTMFRCDPKARLN